MPDALKQLAAIYLYIKALTKINYIRMKTSIQHMCTAATDDLRLKSILDLSDEDLHERLWPIAENITNEIWSKTFYFLRINLVNIDFEQQYRWVI